MLCCTDNTVTDFVPIINPAHAFVSKQHHFPCERTQLLCMPRFYAEHRVHAQAAEICPNMFEYVPPSAGSAAAAVAEAAAAVLAGPVHADGISLEDAAAIAAAVASDFAGAAGQEPGQTDDDLDDEDCEDDLTVGLRRDDMVGASSFSF